MLLDGGKYFRERFVDIKSETIPEAIPLGCVVSWLRQASRERDSLHLPLQTGL